MSKNIPIDFVPAHSRLRFIRKTSCRDAKKKTYEKAIYECVCGKQKEINTNAVKMGQTISCGCYNSEQTAKRATRHGYNKHPAYRVWAHMVRRCYNVDSKEYPNYGGRGVVMCDEWRNNPGIFVEWAIANGWVTGLDIDKDIKAKEMGIEALLYSPEMCQFVTRRTNLNERRNSVKVTYGGRTYNIAQWDEIMGWTKGTLRRRLVQYKWPLERAFTEPIKQTA